MRITEKIDLVFEHVFEQFGDFGSFKSALNVCDEQVCDTCETHTWYEGVALERLTVCEVVWDFCGENKTEV